jgi:hypothetical protein
MGDLQHRLHGLVCNGYANVAVALKHPQIDMADQTPNGLFRDRGGVCKLGNEMMAQIV